MGLSLAIDPVILEIGPVSVKWYGFLIALSVLLGLWIARREANRLGLDPDIFLDALIWILPAAIVGARLYYVLFNWDRYSMHPIRMIATWEGGLAIHGALIGACIAGFFFVRRRGVPFMLLADIVAPSVILGQAIGRWGNFMNQEAYGGPVTVAFLKDIHLPNWIINQMNILGTTYHPTFLYESLWNVIGVSILITLRYINPLRGALFSFYLLWYSVGRFFIEGLRTDSLTFYGPNWVEKGIDFLWSPMNFLFQAGAMEDGNIRTAQFLSILVILGASLFLLYLKKKKGPKYSEL